MPLFPVTSTALEPVPLPVGTPPFLFANALEDNGQPANMSAVAKDLLQFALKSKKGFICPPPPIAQPAQLQQRGLMSHLLILLQFLHKPDIRVDVSLSPAHIPARHKSAHKRTLSYNRKNYFPGRTHSVAWAAFICFVAMM